MCNFTSYIYIPYMHYHANNHAIPLHYQRRSDRVDLCSLRSLTRVPSTGMPRPVPAKVWGLSGRELTFATHDLLSKSARTLVEWFVEKQGII